ncbi:hypothetical protein [Thiofilum flexile]|uniref:hypothetical protein n=1 Tax=Thiofilum flexile TaxID=125627 RepID=UPI00036972E3|nr:hypothetical protein [Thiofilum flexile]
MSSDKLSVPHVAVDEEAFEEILKNFEAFNRDPNHPARQATKDHLANTGGWGLDESGNIVFTPPTQSVEI